MVFTPPAIEIFCQSCGMLIEKPAHHGTEKGGKPAKEYCVFCYQEGKFTEPDITEEKMFARMTDIVASKVGLPQGVLKAQGRKLFSELKRWKKKE